MKNLKTTLVSIAAAIVLAVGFSACEDIFNVAPILNYGGGQYAFTVPATDVKGTFPIEETIATADVKAFIEKAGYNIDNFKMIAVTAASVEITSGNANFDIVDNASASFSADGTELKEFASVVPEKKGLTKVTLTVDKSLNLLDLFKAETLKGIATITTNEAVAEDVQMRVNYSLQIQPNL